MKTTPTIFFLILIASCASEDPRHRFQAVEITRIDSIQLHHLADQDVASMATDGRHWFLAFHHKPLVVKTDLRFQEIRRYDRSGFGPGEMVTTRDIGLRDSRIWVTDFDGRSIHRFDLDLSYLDRLPLEFRPFSLLVFSDSVAWLGSMDMSFEDLYEATGTGHNPRVTRIRSRQVANPPESVLLHAGDHRLAIQYRPYTNRVTVYEDGIESIGFDNILRPARVGYETGTIGPMPNSKIHQTAFTARNRLCLVSGVALAGRHEVACFTISGEPSVTFELSPAAALAATHGDTLLTYSPVSRHVYRYLLDF